MITHVYVLEDMMGRNPKNYFEVLPLLTKEIRRHVKAPHGNKIRTLILEEGFCNISGPDRKGKKDLMGDVIQYRYKVYVVHSIQLTEEESNRILLELQQCQIGGNHVIQR